MRHLGALLVVECILTAVANQGVLDSNRLVIIEPEELPQPGNDLWVELLFELACKGVQSPISHIFSILNNAKPTADQSLGLLGHQSNTRAHSP